MTYAAVGKHGTYSTYARGACRCDLCVTQQRERVRANRADRLASGRLSHGTRSAYDAGCRCDLCRRARVEADFRTGRRKTPPPPLPTEAQQAAAARIAERDRYLGRTA